MLPSRPVTTSAPKAFPFAALAALCALSLGSCIDRPYEESPAQARAAKAPFDRASVHDALLAAPPPDMIPVGAVFGNAIELLGYRAEPAALIPGQRARITLFWRSRAPLEAWHIFVHLDDANGSGERIHAEHDPVQGRFPIDAWRPGDIVADAFVIQVGQVPLNLFLGLYSNGETRLTLDSPGRGRDDGSNRLLAGTIPLAH
jgi:hypothetical protein